MKKRKKLPKGFREVEWKIEFDKSVSQAKRRAFISALKTAVEARGGFGVTYEPDK